MWELYQLLRFVLFKQQHEKNTEKCQYSVSGSVIFNMWWKFVGWIAEYAADLLVQWRYLGYKSVRMRIKGNQLIQMAMKTLCMHVAFCVLQNKWFARKTELRTGRVASARYGYWRKPRSQMSFNLWLLRSRKRERESGN